MLTFKFQNEGTEETVFRVAVRKTGVVLLDRSPNAAISLRAKAPPFIPWVGWI